MRATLPLLLASTFVAAGCLPDADLKAPFEIEPIVRDDGWTIGSPAEQGFDPDALRKAYAPVFDEKRLPTIFSMLVFRHGVLVAEGYARTPSAIDKLENIKSATKSFTSVLLGIAIDEGAVDPDIDRTLASYLPEAFAGHPEYAEVTLRHALTMQTGSGFDNDSDTNVLRGDRYRDSVDFVLRQPRVGTPGDEFLYNDGSPHLIGALIVETTGESLDAFATRVLFEPLGIARHHWDRHVDGLHYGAFGVYLVPRDFARFGQMVLDGGIWQGRRIVSQSYLDDATRGHVEGPDGWHYGYYFWLDADRGIVAARGHGGQRLLMVPEHDLLVTITAEPTGSGDKGLSLAEIDELLGAVITAIRE